jgi:transmembrane sensor
MDSKPTEPETAEAVRWYLRLRAQDSTLAERRAFQAWLARDAVHACAYERARNVSGLIDQLAQQDHRLRELAAAALKDRAASPPRTLQWRAAAALTLGIGLAAMVVQKSDPDVEPAIAHYTNGGVQQQLIELPDGSRVHLDVGTELDVRMTNSERILNLRGGRAYFEVAHDPSRPFAVAAGGISTVALGTRFQVALGTHGVMVTLAEGSVAVLVKGAGGWREVLQPGQQLQLSVGGADRKRHDVDAAEVLGWASGRLVFRDAQLTDVLEEINRYATVKLRLGDASLGNVPVGGTFVTGADSAQVAAALSAALPLSTVQVGAREIVFFRRYEAAD